MSQFMNLARPMFGGSTATQTIQPGLSTANAAMGGASLAQGLFPNGLNFGNNSFQSAAPFFSGSTANAPGLGSVMNGFSAIGGPSTGGGFGSFFSNLFNEGGLVKYAGGGRVQKFQEGGSIEQVQEIQRIRNLLKQNNFNDTAIAAVLGNVSHETGGTFDAQQKQIGGGSGFGLFQLDSSGKKPDYKKWLKTKKQKDSADNQVKFFVDTIYGDSQDIVGRKNAAEIRKALESGDPLLASKVLEQKWFIPGKPHTKRRLTQTSKFMELVGLSPEEIPDESLLQDVGTTVSDKTRDPAFEDLLQRAINNPAAVDEPPAPDTTQQFLAMLKMISDKQIPLQPEPQDTRIQTNEEQGSLDALFKTLSGNPQGYAEGGGVRKFAEGGLLQYLTPQYWKDNPAGSQSWLTQQGRQNWANSPLGSSVNALGEKIVNDPLEAAGWAMMAHPAARGVSTVGKAGLKAASPTLLKMVQKSPQLLKNKKIRDALLLGGGAALAFAPDVPTEQQLREQGMLQELDAEDAARKKTPEETTADSLLTDLGVLTQMDEDYETPHTAGEKVPDFMSAAFRSPQQQQQPQGSNIDKALVAMGAKILASPGVNPLTALGQGIGVYLDVKTAEAKLATDVAQQQFENTMMAAQKEINRMQIDIQKENLELARELMPLQKQELEAQIALNQAKAQRDPLLELANESLSKNMQYIMSDEPTRQQMLLNMYTTLKSVGGGSPSTGAPVMPYNPATGKIE
jgi:hypothetical protein